MRLIETIKIVNGKCLNLEYHCRRAEFTIQEPVVSDEFAHGTIKWRIVYGDNLPVESQMSHYALPRINSLRMIDATKVDYTRKYEDRSSIEKLMRLRGLCDDILIHRNGMVSDTSFCNVVFENEYGLFTPSTPLLEGTKRQMLLDRGIIAERDIMLADIPNFSNVRLINAMIEIEDNVIIQTENIIL